MTQNKMKPIAWLDTRDNKVVVRGDYYNGGHVRPDGAIPDNWLPLYLARHSEEAIEALDEILRIIAEEITPELKIALRIRRQAQSIRKALTGENNE